MNLTLQQKREILEEIGAYNGRYIEWGICEGIDYSIETYTSDFSKLVTNSGWENDFLGSELTVITNKVINTGTLPISMSYPAYYQGRRYMIIPGDTKSYFTSRMMNIEHKLIHRHVKIVAAGRVHYLIDPFDKMKVVFQDSQSETYIRYQKEIETFINEY